MKIFLVSVYTSYACYDTHEGIIMAGLMSDLLKSQQNISGSLDKVST